MLEIRHEHIGSINLKDYEWFLYLT
jgi:hypothetical protein